MRTPSSVLVAALVTGLLAFGAAAQSVTFKVASLAPKGSAWANILTRGAADIEKKTEGRVKVQFFFQGQGDEKDIVRKVKLGQLDGAALTGIGLGLINPDVRVLDIPFAFTSDKQLDYVRKAMAPDFERQFKEAGYILLGWGDVGWVHLYSNIEVNSKDALKKTKMWTWTDDPIAKGLFSQLGIEGVGMGVPDVLPSLSTGKIDACYGSPLAAVALQWYTKVKFATSQPIGYASGALIVSKKVFEKLAAADQKAMIEGGHAVGEQLKGLVRKDNERAKAAMKKSGIAFTETPAAFVTELRNAATAARSALVGKDKSYSKTALDTFLKHLAAAPK